MEEKEIWVDIVGEVWKPIKDHNKYMISNYGRVKTIRNKKEKLCKIKSGAVNICGQRYNINLLVLEYFGHIVLLDEEEEFRDILNYEGLYQISNRKRVLNINTGKILIEATQGTTVFVRLKKDEIIKATSIDILYNQAFGGETVEDLDGEIWKDICDIKGFEEFKDYQISNMGRVKSLKNWCEKLMKPRDEGHGYFQVGLTNINKEHKFFRVHRLVAFAFIPNDDPINKNEVNHINEIKDDNRAENLEWCDRSYNVSYGDCRKNAVKTRRENGNGNVRKVYCEELDRVFPSIQAIVDEFGYDRNNIWCCINHRHNQQVAYGLHFHYYKEDFKDEN